GAAILTAFNDNAAVTYLASQAPQLADAAKYAVVAGAVTGGGLTVIANAPNPAGQAILGRFFQGGVSPAKLALAALLPTIIVGMAFMLL
ncbi:MAG: putative Na+/H+ antiporter, partial [Verrucomicrobiota bacterium]|nr:putative Na+/H+ antiporter [Verrucomicrobiota bacterium]